MSAIKEIISAQENFWVSLIGATIVTPFVLLFTGWKQHPGALLVLSTLVACLASHKFDPTWSTYNWVKCVLVFWLFAGAALINALYRLYVYGTKPADSADKKDS